MKTDNKLATHAQSYAKEAFDAIADLRDNRYNEARARGVHQTLLWEEERFGFVRDSS